MSFKFYVHLHYDHLLQLSDGSFLLIIRKAFKRKAQKDFFSTVHKDELRYALLRSLFRLIHQFIFFCYLIIKTAD